MVTYFNLTRLTTNAPEVSVGLSDDEFNLILEGLLELYEGGYDKVQVEALERKLHNLRGEYDGD